MTMVPMNPVLEQRIGVLTRAARCITAAAQASPELEQQLRAAPKLDEAVSYWFDTWGAGEAMLFFQSAYVARRERMSGENHQRFMHRLWAMGSEASAMWTFIKARGLSC